MSLKCPYLLYNRFILNVCKHVLKLNQHQKTVMQVRLEGNMNMAFNDFRGVKNRFYSSKLAAWADADGNIHHVSQKVGFPPWWECVAHTHTHTHVRTHTAAPPRDSDMWPGPATVLWQAWDWRWFQVSCLHANEENLILMTRHHLGFWGLLSLLVVGRTFSCGVSAEFLFLHILEPE